MKPIRPTAPAGYITCDEAAAYLNIKRAGVSYHINHGRLVPQRIGTYVFVRKDEVVAIADRGMKAKAGETKYTDEQFKAVVEGVRKGKTIVEASLMAGFATSKLFYLLASPAIRSEVSGERAVKRSTRAFNLSGKSIMNYAGVMTDEELDY